MGLAAKSSGGPTVGIDIGSDLIKVVEAKPGKDGIQVTALGIAPTPPGTISNEVISDPQALGQAIRKLLTESGISCKRSVSSVAGQSSVIVRIIEVPKMTKQELAETMKWEIERHVPFAANEVIMDFQPIERSTTAPDDQNMEVLLAVAQREVINAHIETLFAAGLEPVAIDVQPLAVCRSLVDSSSDDARQQTIAIVNIGSTSTEMGVYQNGLLTFPRTLPIAGGAITRALSDGLNISVQQAERLKREKAVVLLDRAAQFAPSAGFGEMEQLSEIDQSDATVGLSDSTAQDKSGGDFGFIPGLGFGIPEEPSAGQPDTAANSDLPDFDVDMGTPVAEPIVPVMDFDLAGTDDGVAAPPKAQFDISGSADDITSASAELSEPLTQFSAEENNEIALPEFSEETIFDAILPVLNDLIAEIRRSLEYFASRFQSQPDRILLCGGSAKLKDLDKLIQGEMGIPVFVANPLQNVTVFSKALSEDYLEEVATIFPVSVGLAIRDMIGE